jgi:hypothetical protein
MAIMLKRRRAEQELLRTRMLMQQHEQDVLDKAYLAAANASSSGSTLGSALHSLAGDRLGLDLRMQARLQQRRQMEGGLLPPKCADFVSIPQRPNLDLARPNLDLARPYLHDGARLGGPLKKQRVNQAHFVQASQAPDIPFYSEEKEDYPVARKVDDNMLPYGGGNEPFPQKLYQMLQEAEENGQEDVLSFFEHGRTFAIHNLEKFFNDIMPKYFRATRMSSFRRQLQLYGFRAVVEGRNKVGYYHKFFLKGRQELLKQINRRLSLNPGGSALSKISRKLSVLIDRRGPALALEFQ